jgi:arylsulfatase A-like enzyme
MLVGYAQAQDTRSVAAGKKPNIVLVLMDNLGWGEPGVYGGGILRGAHPLTSVDGNCRLARATGVTNF